MTDDLELCSKCGAPLYGGRTLGGARLCPRHLREAQAAAPVFACTTEAIDDGYEPSEEEIERVVQEAHARRATVTDISTRRRRDDD